MAALLVFGVRAYVFEWVRDLSDRTDASFFDLVARVRTDWLTDVANAIDRIGSGWTLTVVAIAMLVALVVFKRWRHLFTLLGSIVVIELIARHHVRGVRAPTAVRRHDHRALGRLLDARARR